MAHVGAGPPPHGQWACLSRASSGSGACPCATGTSHCARPPAASSSATARRGSSSSCGWASSSWR
eukprot:3402687-Prymnesium_polylepis.1